MGVTKENVEKLAGKQPKVTAKSARQLADAPSKLLTWILNTIKDDAEAGRIRTIFSSSCLSEKGEIFIIDSLKNLGFDVVSRHQCRHQLCELADAFCAYQDEIEFNISW